MTLPRHPPLAGPGHGHPGLRPRRVATVALARWNGAAIPAALIQGGIAFAGILALCCAMLGFLRGSPG